MWETLKKRSQAQVAILLFFVLTLWWIVCIYALGSESKRFFGDFASIYGVMALFGAVCGIGIAFKWGGLKSVMGKAILLFSFGLLAQEFGQITYAYFSFFQHIDVPYPSLGDLGYFGSIPLYILGVLYLGKASGVKLGTSSLSSKLQAIIIPIVMLAVGYILFLQNYTFDQSNLLKTLLDFGYPLGQAIYISLAILTYLLSKHVLGGIMKNKLLFILFALCVQFLCDYTFLYQSSRGTWSAGGVNDYMYLIAYFVMTIGLIQFGIVLSKLRN